MFKVQLKKKWFDFNGDGSVCIKDAYFIARKLSVGLVRTVVFYLLKPFALALIAGYGIYHYAMFGSVLGGIAVLAGYMIWKNTEIEWID